MQLTSGTYRDGPAEVVAIRAMSCAFQVADRQVGGGVLYDQLVRYLNTEIGPRLLDADGTSGPALFTAASSITEIAGWMAHDCGQAVLAQLDQLGAALGPHQQLPEVGAFLAVLPVVRRDKAHGGEMWPV